MYQYRKVMKGRLFIESYEIIFISILKVMNGTLKNQRGVMKEKKLPESYERTIISEIYENLS